MMAHLPLTPTVLALANLRRRSFRTGSMVFLVALFAFVLFGGAVLHESLRNGLDSLSARLGGDILVVPHGYEKDVTVTLLRGEPSAFYLKADVVDRIRQIPGVEAATSQLFVASLNAGCCSAAVQLIGFDPSTDFVVTPWMKDRLDHALGARDAIVGSMIVPDKGGEVTFFREPFAVVAKMDRTGMGFDTSVFMTMDGARDMMRRSGRFTGDLEALDDLASVVIVKAAPNVDAKALANDIMLNLALDYDLDVVVAARMMTSIGRSLGALSVFVYGLGALLWGLALITLFIVFSVSINERKRELSLLRLLGATRRRLAGLVLMEALIVGVVGALIGTFAGALVVFPFSTLIARTLSQPYLELTVSTSVFLGVAAVLIAALTGPIAALWTAFSVTRFDVYETLREGEG